MIELLKPLMPKEILVSSDYLSDDVADGLQIRKVSQKNLFSSSDVIHCLESLTVRTFEVIGAKELGLIQDGAVLINAGRAHLINEAALINELAKGRFTAILDVFHKEPLPHNSPILNMPNVILSPHCAGLGNRDLYVPCVLEEFQRHFKGQSLQHGVSLTRAKNMTQEFKTLKSRALEGQFVSDKKQQVAQTAP